jgi:hypothetical protein
VSRYVTRAAKPLYVETPLWGDAPDALLPGLSVDDGKSVLTHYDAEGDVAYVSRGTMRENYSEDEDQEPSIWLRRADEDDTPVGVTILDYSTTWAGRTDELADKIASFLALTPSDVRTRLNAMREASAAP